MSNRLVHALRKLVTDLEIPAYDLITHQGFIRFAIVREGKNTNQTMLTLVTADKEFPRKDEFVTALKEQFPELTTIVWVVNTTITNIARGEVQEILHGPGYIEETLLGLKFRINPGAFFQTNSRQTERLYQTAIDMAELSSGDSLLDLYCGAGTIGLCAAAHVKEVVGIDIETEAIDAASFNAELNGIDTARFYAGAVRKILLQDDLKDKIFDPVVIDPPRAGMHPKAMHRLLDISPRRIVYISCNPATFARDAKELTAAGYTLHKIIPFDMFPHTMHIELVSRFEKNA
jgi:23S rRNA (uracil1939-C5)-methyltransferase